MEHVHKHIERPDPHPSNGRRLVTLAQWHARPEILKTRCAFFLLPQSANGNVENWRVLDSQTPLEDDSGRFTTWVTGSDSSRCMPGDTLVYVTAEDFALLGL